MQKSLMVVLLSGGMDSTTLLSRVVTFKDVDVRTVAFDYGQKHKRELLRSAYIAHLYKVPHHVLTIDPSTFAGARSSLVNPDIAFEEFSEGTYEELQAREGAQPTVVPNRNMLMLAMAAAYAISQSAPGQKIDLGIAAHAGDAHNYHYPDCTPEFLGTLNTALQLSSSFQVNLYTPFIEMTKGDIVKAGVGMGTPYSDTMTCYQGLEPACGKCATCQERIYAFKEAGYKDPLPYAIDIDWAGLTVPLIG